MITIIPTEHHSGRVAHTVALLIAGRHPRYRPYVADLTTVLECVMDSTKCLELPGFSVRNWPGETQLTLH